MNIFSPPRSQLATVVFIGSITAGMVISAAYTIDGFRNGYMALVVGASVIFVVLFIWLTVVMHRSYRRYGFFWGSEIGMSRRWRKKRKELEP